MEKENKTIPGPGYLKIGDYAKKKKVDRSCVYRKIKTAETPNGVIEVEVGTDGKWYIHWETHKNVSFRKDLKKRTVK